MGKIANILLGRRATVTMQMTPEQIEEWNNDNHNNTSGAWWRLGQTGTIVGLYHNKDPQTYAIMEFSDGWCCEVVIDGITILAKSEGDNETTA